MEIVIIGSGNVATALGKKALVAGHDILQVVSRDPGHARQLAQTLGCAHGSISGINRDAFIYLLAVSDGAIPEVAASLQLKRALILHTAGSVSKHVLAKSSTNYGVLWPLQSLRKETEVPAFPLIIDANTNECMTLVSDFAHSLTDVVEVMDDEQRRKMHLAAVMSGNFSNHLFTLVQQYCRHEQLDFRLLQPMLKETVDRLAYADPASMQTGPAIRGDVETMNRHMEMLQEHEDLRELYDLFSALIFKVNS